MENGTLPFPVVEPDIPSQSRQSGRCWGIVKSEVEHGLWFKVFLALPVAIFLVFLVFRARRSLSKLLHSRSHVMTTYYSFLWVVAFLNIIWFVLQIKQAKDGGTTMWNVAALVVSFGTVLLEVSVVVFLSQGYLVSGWNALMRTLVCAGVVAAVDTFLKAFYIFGLGIPLFLAQEDAGNWQKWLFLLVRNLFFVGLYLCILILPHTNMRDRLPARPSFYRYIFILFIFYVSSAFGTALIGFGADFGYCLHGLAGFFYNALYPPLLYVTFLADFFLEDDLQFDDVYYSEMKDAGYFDAWD